jgi:hypothetical protein
VGKPRISYYDNPSWIRTKDAPGSHTAFIQIPHIDPGRDKYGKQPEALRRVLLLTWMSTLAINFFMIKKVLDLANQSEEPEDFDEAALREEICREVIGRYEREADTLVVALENAKEALGRIWEVQNKARISLPTALRAATSSKHAQVIILSSLAYL